MLIIQNLEYIENNKKILNNVNLQIESKKIGIIGNNGSGKSTLLRIIKGLIIPTSGKIIVNNIENTSKIRKDIGIIFQNPDHQIIFSEIKEELAFGLQNSKLNKPEIKAKIDKIIKEFDIKYLKDRSTFNFSGGEKQLLSILGVLITNPQFLLFDEPTAFLDLKNKNKIFKLIKSLKQTCIVATHDLDFLLDFDEIFLLEKGRLIEIGKPIEIIEKYKSKILNNELCF